MIAQILLNDEAQINLLSMKEPIYFIYPIQNDQLFDFKHSLND